MADAPKRKPAARKPAKRGPTKAAALKALGLTQEELDVLKATAAAVSAVRNATDSDSERRGLEALVGHKLPETRTGRIEGEERKIITADATVAADPQQHLEDRPAPERREWNSPDPDSDPVFYVRNLRNVDVGFRLSRQQKQGEKRTNLRGRGIRGDLQKLEPGDLKDTELQTQVSFGLVEVIPEGEALEVIRKQYTNAQQQVPAHIAMLRNPKGEEYAQANPVQFATDEEAYGTKVADLDPGLMQGKLSDKEIKRGGGFVQNAQQTPTGGNPAIISDGFMAPTQGDAQLGSNDERSQQVDALARSNQFEGPGAGLGEVTVKVEPVQRVR